jgi:hypothetical protein
MNTSSRIWITFQKIGIHAYPAAPADVGYLSHPHRHLFKFKVWVNVHHQDREIEFHQFLNWCEAQYTSGILTLNSKSCEMIAEELLLAINSRYPGRNPAVEVSEDGECGAIVSLSGTAPTGEQQ